MRPGIRLAWVVVGLGFAQSAAAAKPPLWVVVVKPTGELGICRAETQVDPHHRLSLIAGPDSGDWPDDPFAIAVAADEPLTSGGRGYFESDVFSFAFKPVQDGPRTVRATTQYLGMPMKGALNNATFIRLTVDGRPLIEMRPRRVSWTAPCPTSSIARQAAPVHGERVRARAA